MKKLSIVITFLVFLVLLPISANAGPCERYWDELTNECFVTTIAEIEYTACFSDSVSGPCPGGQIVLSYVDIQVIDGIEYEALIEIDLSYATDYKYVIIGELDFMLINGQLVLLPEDPLVFDLIED